MKKILFREKININILEYNKKYKICKTLSIKLCKKLKNKLNWNYHLKMYLILLMSLEKNILKK